MCEEWWWWQCVQYTDSLQRRPWYICSMRLHGSWHDTTTFRSIFITFSPGESDARYLPFSAFGDWQNQQWCPVTIVYMFFLLCFGPTGFKTKTVSLPAFAFAIKQPLMNLGAALIHLCEAGMFGSMRGPGKYQDKLTVVLRVAHRDFLKFKKLNKLQCSQPRFTPSRLSRRVQTSISPFN